MIIFAHRGASGYSPQNSIASAKKAIELGANSIEFDVQLSKDEVPVVIHDFILDYLTTNGSGFVKDFTLEELKKLTLTPKNGYNHEKIPTLEEYLTILPDDMLINIELKSCLSDNRDLSGGVANILKIFPHKRNILISSFDHELLKNFYSRFPQYMIGALISTNVINMNEYFKNIPIKLKSVNLSLDLVQEELITNIKNLGYQVFVYTVNDKKIALELMKIGVDGIFSDFPDILKSL